PGPGSCGRRRQSKGRRNGGVYAHVRGFHEFNRHSEWGFRGKRIATARKMGAGIRFFVAGGGKGRSFAECFQRSGYFGSQRTFEETHSRRKSQKPIRFIF